MSRKLALLLVSLLCAPGLVQALGLGKLEKRSALNEPFDARIELIGATGDEIDSLKVGLADSDQFQRAGIERGDALLQLHFEVTTTPKGADYIHVTSQQPVREPFLNFLLEVNWSRGRLFREYTVLLDPPMYDSTRKAALQPARAAPVRAPAPVAAQRTPAVGGTQTPNEYGVIYGAPAPATSRARSVSAGGGVSAAAAAGRATEAGDTLWSIAESARPDRSVSVQQMMVAIFRANPDAFIRDNMNALKKGQILKIPDPNAVAAVTRDDALDIVRQHQSLWEEYRQGRSEQVVERPAGASSAEGTAASAPGAVEYEVGGTQTPNDHQVIPGEAAPPAPEGELRLVAPSEGAMTAEAGTAAPTTGTEDGAGLESLRNDLALANEQMVARQQENTELQDQLHEAEQLIADLQRAVKLRDDELAALQAQLAQQAAPAPAPEAAEPAPVTPPEESVEAPATPPETAAAPEQPTEEAAPPPAPAPEPEPTVAETPEAETPPAVVPPPPPPAGFMQKAEDMVASVVPPGILAVLPGGARTALGILVLLVLLLLWVIARAISGREREVPMSAALATARRAAPVTVPPLVEEVEPITETRVTAPTIVPAEPQDTTEFAITTTRLAQPLVDEAPTVRRLDLDEDPLAEVNVYLAYERFDQAEELVKRAIAEYPDEHKYKLRLLEVYYSANNKRAYEDAARTLNFAIGGTGPLWESAVAMWQEMSPDRPLFAPGADDLTLTAMRAEASKQFVDITGETAEDALSRTLSMEPAEEMEGDNEPTVLRTEAPATLDFDLAGSPETSPSPEILDITAAVPEVAGDELVLDLTSPDSAAETPESEIFDLTGGEPGRTMQEVFDMGEVGAELSEHDLLDLTATAGHASEWITEPDLLDVTKTGGEDLSLSTHDELLNVTAPGFDPGETLLDITGGPEPPPFEDVLDITGTSDMAPADNIIEFDIGVKEEPPEVPPEAFSTQIRETAAELLEITADSLGRSPPHAREDDHIIEFDVSSLSSPAARLPLVEEDDDRTAFLNLAEVDEDATELLLDDITSPGSPLGMDETHDSMPHDLDLTLDETALSSLGEDANLGDTIELPQLESAAIAVEDDDTSLEELSLALEDTINSLQDKQIHPDDTLELAIDSESETVHEFHLDIGLDTDMENPPPDLRLDIDTIKLDAGDYAATDPGHERTLVLPSAPGMEQQGEADEVDTKLNLAKAYIELGDTAGARAILDEVVQEGTPDQRREAQGLLGQLK